VAVQACKENLNLPCGWVYWVSGAATEYCLPWQDRAEIPHMLEMAESLYGKASLAVDPRFGGVPLCWYRCAPGSGCNALSGCLCFEESP